MRRLAALADTDSPRDILHAVDFGTLSSVARICLCCVPRQSMMC